MKRFLLFAGCNYYPCGGMKDFCNDFDNLAEAIATGDVITGIEQRVCNDATETVDWFQIYDTKKRTIVKHFW